MSRFSRRRGQLSAIVFLCGLIACQPAICAEEKILSLAVNPVDDNYSGAFSLAIEAGVRGQPLIWKWSDLEPSPGKFDLLDAVNSIQFLCKQKSFTVLVNLPVINSTVKEIPADLYRVPFNSSEMAQRFHDLIDGISPLMDPHVKYLVIGNEVDVYLSRNPEEWDAYQKFYEDALDYVHHKIPGILVGVCVTHEGVKGAYSANILSLTRKSDVWVTTCYPFGNNFKPLKPDSVGAILEQMVQFSGNLPVVIQEIGYPSAAFLDSSEKNQADFVSATLRAWGDQGEKIPFLSFWEMYDPSEEEVEQLASYYGLSGSPQFKAYLKSLGFRNSDGSPKPAWSAFIEVSREKGFIR